MLVFTLIATVPAVPLSERSTSMEYWFELQSGIILYVAEGAVQGQVYVTCCAVAAQEELLALTTFKFTVDPAEKEPTW